MPLVVMRSPNLFKNRYPLPLPDAFNQPKASPLKVFGINNLRTLPPFV